MRKTEPKPLRIYLADTSGDVDNAFGSWPWSNQLLNSALQYMGYDVRFDWAEGYAHNADHGGALFPEALKWLWRKEPYQPQIDTKGDLRGDMTLLKLLVPGETWTVVADKLGFADAPCTDADGNFYFSDMKAPAVYKLSVADGTRTELVKEAVSGLEFGPDGLLYGCQGAKSRVISLDPNSGAVKEVATNVTPNDLAVTRDGAIYITETKQGRVTRINSSSGETTPVASGIKRPNGIALSSDGGTLAVSDSGGEHVWTFRVNADGTLDAQMPQHDHAAADRSEGGVQVQRAAAVPGRIARRRHGRRQVGPLLRHLGRWASRCSTRPAANAAYLPKPIEAQPLTSCVLAGANHEYLYVTNGNTVFRRKLKVD